MRLRLLDEKSLLPVDQIQTDLRAGVSTKRHEFAAGTDPDVFVVFEGEEECPFWRRDDDGIRFVYTDLTFERALSTANQPESFLGHSVHDADGQEFLSYYQEARQKHFEF